MELAVTLTETVANPIVGDLYLGDDGNEVVHTDLALEVVQRLNVRFLFFKGEWFLNLDSGTPWFQSLLVKGPSDAVIRSVIGQVITGTEGVATLVSLSYSISRARHLSVTFKAKLNDGSVLDSRDFQPFVVAAV